MGHPTYSPSELSSLSADSQDYEDATEEELEAGMAFTLGLSVEEYRKLVARELGADKAAAKAEAAREAAYVENWRKNLRAGGAIYERD